MKLSDSEKQNIQNTIINKISPFKEVEKIVIFGSFFKSNEPNDIDVAVFENIDDDFMSLSLKYRKSLRELAKKIPMDILPIKKDASGLFLDEINSGKVIYER